MIGIAGAGLTGLAAANRLHQPGHDSRVFEAGDDTSGLAVVCEPDGHPIETSYRHLPGPEGPIVDRARGIGHESVEHYR